MSFWGTLAKGLGIAGAPLTGGLSLIPVAAGVAGDIVSAKIQAGAANKAADAQAQSARDALDFEKGVYNGNLSAYNNGLGSLVGQSTQRLGDLLARPQAAPATSASVFASGQLPPGSMSLGQMQGGQAQPAAAGGMVTLQSPDGETRMVRPESVQKYLAMGARRVA